MNAWTLESCPQEGTFALQSNQFIAKELVVPIESSLNRSPKTFSLMTFIAEMIEGTTCIL